MKKIFRPGTPSLVVEGTVTIGRGGSGATTASDAVSFLGGYRTSQIGKPNGPADLDANLKIPKERFMADPMVTIWARQKSYRAGVEASFLITNYSDKRLYELTAITGTIRREHDVIFWTPGSNANNGFIINGQRYSIPVVINPAVYAAPELIYNNTDDDGNTTIVFNRVDPTSQAIGAVSIPPKQLTTLQFPSNAKGYYIADPTAFADWSRSMSGYYYYHQVGSFVDLDLFKSTAKKEPFSERDRGIEIFDLPTYQESSGPVMALKLTLLDRGFAPLAVRYLPYPATEDQITTTVKALATQFGLTYIHNYRLENSIYDGYMVIHENNQPYTPPSNNNVTFYLDTNDSKEAKDLVQVVWFGGSDDHMSSDWEMVYATYVNGDLDFVTVKDTGNFVDLYQKKLNRTTTINGAECTLQRIRVRYNWASGESTKWSSMVDV